MHLLQPVCNTLVVNFEVMNFAREIANWYYNNKRDLPWRHTTDAYIIWLSEIILQQTRVEQGMPYFHRFAERYPDVKSLAAASEDEVLKIWQGLGYYSRGRNMLKTAQMVVNNHGGVFPSTYNELIKLKGIGEYTASAIASFAGNEARAVVDGNVYRVLSRFFGITEPINSNKAKKLYQQLADEVLDTNQPALHNQAMMEFGALLCKPKNPACGICPVRLDCYAFKHNAVNALPVKLKKLKVKERYLNYFLVTDGDRILMNKRDETDIWAGMYDLPLIETLQLLPVTEVLNLPESKFYFGENNIADTDAPVVKHILTHQKLYVRLIKLNKPPLKLEQKWFYIEVEKLKYLALPKIIFIFLKNIFNL